MPMRRYRLIMGLVVLLGVGVVLAACAPFGEATPTIAPPPMATIAPGPAPSAPSTPVTTAPAATAVPTAALTAAPTSMATPPSSTATIPAPTVTVPATPTLAPTATVPPSTVPPIPPTLAPVSPTPLVGASATDVQGRCAITLPAGFTATGGGAFSGSNGRASIALTPLAIGASDTLDDVAQPFVSTFIAATGDYQQTAVARGEDNLRLDFTGRTVAPGRGTIFLRQFGGTVCALSFFVVQGGEVGYDQTVNALLASLRPAGAIGYVGARAERPDRCGPYLG